MGWSTRPPHAHMKNYVIFDIDSTLAHNQWRVKLFDDFQSDANYAKYKALAPQDKPNPPCIAIARYFLEDIQWNCFFFSGREEDERQTTLIWLQDEVNVDIGSSQLFLRPLGTNNTDLDDATLKLGWANKVTHNDLSRILFVLEDRNFVVEAWRKNGVYCIQPQLGDF